MGLRILLKLYRNHWSF